MHIRAMPPKPTAHINPWFAFKASGVRSYIAGTVAVLTLSVAVSIYMQSWSWISRSGAVVILFGVLLSLRRLFRLGPQNLDEPAEPAVVNGNQFNLKHMHQSIERLTDNFAQTCGVSLMVLGTILSAYGDIVLEYLVPLR
jgi:hypothetical protein